MPDGRIVVASATGVTVFDGEEWQPLRVHHLSRSGCTSVSVAPDRSIWISTRHHGVYRFHEGRWTRFDRENGLDSNEVTSVIALSAHRALTTSREAVSTFDGERFYRLPTPDELVSFSLRRGGGESIWIGETFRYDPDREPPETYLQIAPDEFPHGGIAVARWAGVDPWNRSSRESLLYSWRLNGGPWSTFVADTEVEWRDLPAGQHWLEIRARDPDLNVDPTPERWGFTVLPPFWQRGWFITLAAMLGLVITAQAGRIVFHARALRRKHELLEVTQRELARHTETQLARFQSICDFSPVGMFVSEPDGTGVYLNPILENLLGLDLEETRNLAWADVIHPDDRERVLATWAHALEQREPFLVSARIVRPDKTMIWYEARGAPVSVDGQYAGFVGTVVDTTEQRQAELQLRQNEERLRMAMGAAQLGYWDWDLLTEIIVWSAGHERLWGMPAGTYQGTFDEFLQRVHPADRDGLIRELEAAQRSGAPFDHEYRIVWPDGSHRWISGRGRFEYDRNRQPVRMTGVVMDITEKREAQDSLRSSELRYRAIVEDQTELIVRWKPDGRRTFVNAAYRREFQKNGEPLEGSSFLPLIVEEDRAAIVEKIQSLSIENPVATDQHRSIRADGTIRWQEWTDRALFDEEGKIVEIQSVGRDITRLKESQQALEQLNRELESIVEKRTQALADKNAELECYAQTVSHDLRAPLRAVEGFVVALYEDCGHQLDESGHEYLRHIAQSAARMDVLIQDLLGYSRLGRNELSIQSVSLKRVVDKSLESLRTELETRGAEVEIESTPAEVAGHEATLVQVVTNLVSNAAKFVPDGRTPHIHIRAENGHGRVRLWVEDNGIGVDPIHHVRIFQVFERLHGIESYPGTGIGLAIVGRAIHRLGGRCGVESEVGVGSRFWIELPVAEKPA